MLRWLVPGVGPLLASLKPSLRDLPAMAAIPVCAAVLTVMLVVVANLFWRLFFAARSVLCSGADKPAAAVDSESAPPIEAASEATVNLVEPKKEK